MLDEMRKQANAAEEYKKIKSTELSEYNGDYKSKHYTEVLNESITPTYPSKSDSFDTKYADDFGMASRDYWKRSTENGLLKYDAGRLSATFGRPITNVTELLERLSSVIHESVCNEMIQSGISSESLSDGFKMVDLSLKNLSNHLETICKNSKSQQNVSVVDMSAYLHGFINTCVSTINNPKSGDKN